MHIIFLVLPAFILYLNTVYAAEIDLGPPSKFPEFAIVKQADLIGPSAAQVRGNLLDYSEWRFAAINVNGGNRIRIKARRGSRTVLKSKKRRRPVRQVQGETLNQQSSKWKTGETSFISSSIGIPDIAYTINEFVVLSGSGSRNAELFRVVWRRNSWGHHDSFFALVTPDASDGRYWHVHYLGDRSSKNAAKISVNIENNKLSAVFNGKTKCNVNLKNYGDTELDFAAGVTIYDYMAPDDESVVVLYISDLEWSPV